ncbi:MAG: UDP-glucose 4-epimerase GalE [Bacillota bacterium]
MTFLITGGAGYIGSHATKILCDQGYKVVVVDNLTTGYQASVDERAVFYQLDIHETDQLEAMLKKEHIDAVMHFAAFSLVGESVKHPLIYYKNNVEGTRSLLEAMIRAQVHTLIFSSTAAVYGEAKTMPIDENTPLNPSNPYGETKMAIERMLKTVKHALPEFNYVSLRYFNVAGAHHTSEIGENHDPETHLIPNVIKSTLKGDTMLKVFGDDYDTKDGSAVRDYIHVEDLIDAHIKAFEFIQTTNQSDVFNLGTASGYSVFDIIKTCETVMDRPVPYTVSDRRPGDPARLIASHDKAHTMLNWKPKHDLTSIIKSAYDYHKKDV